MRPTRRKRPFRCSIDCVSSMTNDWSTDHSKSELVHREESTVHLSTKTRSARQFKDERQTERKGGRRRDEPPTGTNSFRCLRRGFPSLSSSDRPDRRQERRHFSSNASRDVHRRSFSSEESIPVLPHSSTWSLVRSAHRCRRTSHLVLDRTTIVAVCRSNSFPGMRGYSVR